MEASFEKLLVLLAKSGVRFVLVGGVAVAFQGYVRLTEHVDILIDDAPENVDRILKVLAGYGEGFAGELSAADFTKQEGAIRIVEEGEQMQIDIFTLMSGRHFADVVGEADQFRVGDQTVAVASKPSLIGWKERSPREKDRLDAIALRQLLANPAAFD